MKILFTGASSFTGHWFVLQLAERGHEIWATFTRESDGAYGPDVRRERVNRVLGLCQPRFSCRFGDDSFLSLLRAEKFDLLCHHAADVTNYRSPDFDVERAIANNTFRASEVLQSLAATGGSLILTGTVFEPGEGTGSGGLPAISQYGISKRKTADSFQRECQKMGVRMAKFVISNPYGPWEDARFTTYLARTWSSGGVAAVRTPRYIRDNIPVSLLSAAYVNFAEQISQAEAYSKFNPMGYVESQREFANRVAREMRSRTSWTCGLDFTVQAEFDEPLERVNTDSLDQQRLGWSESAAWDELAEYYERTFVRT